MNNIGKILLFSSLLFLLATCTYDVENEIWCTDPPEAVLPDSVGLGESVLYLNGEKVNWVPEIHMNSMQQTLAFSFYFLNTSYNAFDAIAINRAPMEPGTFEFYTNDDYISWIKANANPPSDQAQLSFVNVVDGDNEGFEYRVEDIEQCFLRVDAVDTVSRQVRAKFRLKFCLDNKNGLKDVGLPNTMVFQGIFNEIAQ